MIRTILSLRLGVVLCLLAAACSSPQIEEAGEGPLGSSDDSTPQANPLLDDDSLAYETDSIVEAGQERAISVDVIGALFPTSSSDADSLIDLYDVFGRIRYLHYVGCMQHAGFEIEPPVVETDGFHNRFYDFPNLEAIAEQGFSDTFTEADPLEDVPVGLQDQYKRDRRACTLAYDDPSEQIWDSSDPLVSQWYEEIYAIDSSSEVVEQFEIWERCMADGGRPVENHRSFFGDVDTVVIDLLESGEFEAAREAELAAAELYVACMGPLEAVRQPMRDAARRAFLTDHAEEVRAIEELAHRLILEVQQQ